MAILDQEIDTRNKPVISADDFGLSPAANRNILALVEAGKVDRVSVILEESDDLEPEEIDKLKSADISLDLHLHFSELTKKGSVQRRIRQSGARTALEILFFYLKNRRQVEMIRQEWSRQIELFRSIFGRLPDGLNSHQYLHFFPHYLDMVLGLVRKYGIGYLRFGSQGVIQCNNFTSWILGLLNRISRKKITTSRIRTSRHLASFDWLDSLEGLPEGTEVICHPERPDEFVKIKG